MERGSPEYEQLKEERSQILWKAVERIIPDIRERCEITMVRLPFIAAVLLILRLTMHTTGGQCRLLCKDRRVVHAQTCVGRA